MFLTNLAVNQGIKWKGKFCRQSFSLHFETIWSLTKFSFDHKWNDARLLLINMLYTSSFMTVFNKFGC